jgi:prepilin-type N-terminal cleavage/methylation domain-containing protein
MDNNQEKNKKSRRLGRGFTLVEALVAIAVFTLLMGATSALIFMSYRTYGMAWRQAAVIEEARRGVEVMIKEIREARMGDNGSYPIERAGDKEFIFYSDIDNDGKIERVRYYFGSIIAGVQTKKNVTFVRGGSTNVTFSNFLQGTLKTAQLKVSTEGDLGSGNEYAEIFSDGVKLANVCQSGCTDCAGTWQGTANFDVSSQASDNSIQFIADGTWDVNPTCDWEENNHSLKAQFELSWTEEVASVEHELRKGVIEPVADAGGQVIYPPDQETTSVLSSYVRNVPPIFEYFNADGNKIIEEPARLADTKVMEIYLVVNVDPNRPPQDFELESSVQLRNLKAE